MTDVNIYLLYDCHLDILESKVGMRGLYALSCLTRASCSNLDAPSLYPVK